jgi:hypothetical protein
MTSTEVPVIKTNDLRSETSFEGSGVLLKLVGSAESEAMGALDDLLTKVHARAIESDVREVTIDMRSLEFMNSSCFKAFVSWIGEVQDLETKRQYRIRFLSDDQKHWQRRSLGALSCFAVDLIQVET